MTTAKIETLKRKIDALTRELEAEEARARGPQPLTLECVEEEGDRLTVSILHTDKTCVTLLVNGRSHSVILNGYDTEQLALRLAEFVAHVVRTT